MPKFKDITGMQIGRFTVVRRDKNIRKRTAWLCICSCGTEKIITGHDLLSGRVVSCGCYMRERTLETHTTHNLTGCRLYVTWQNMKKRCYYKKCKQYKDYGGRGIVICDEWRNDFQAFYEWSKNNGYSDDLTIDRIDNDGNYEPTNCRWVPRSVQAKNKRQGINPYRDKLGRYSSPNKI